MNQRIKELAEQAGTWEYFNAEDEKTKAMDEQALQNFAELVVKECLEQIYSVTIDNPTDDWDQGYDSGLNQAAETIKTHFGVEE